MTTGEKIVTWGLLAYLAWHLSRPAAGVASGGAASASASANVMIPPWVQQLSASINQGPSFFSTPCGISTLGAP